MGQCITQHLRWRAVHKMTLSWQHKEEKIRRKTNLVATCPLGQAFPSLAPQDRPLVPSEDEGSYQVGLREGFPVVLPRVAADLVAWHLKYVHYKKHLSIQITCLSKTVISLIINKGKVNVSAHCNNSQKYLTLLWPWLWPKTLKT